jgi:hypothetical protein
VVSVRVRYLYEKTGAEENDGRIDVFDLCEFCAPHELSWKLSKVTKFHNFPSKLTKLRKLKQSNEVTNSKVGTTRLRFRSRHISVQGLKHMVERARYGEFLGGGEDRKEEKPRHFPGEAGTKSIEDCVFSPQNRNKSSPLAATGLSTSGPRIPIQIQHGFEQAWPRFGSLETIGQLNLC